MADPSQQDAAADGGGAAAGGELLALATGAWRQTILALAAQLDLFALLGARTADLEEVCYSLGTQRQPTQFFLAACEGLSLVEQRDDAYVLGPLGRAVFHRDAAWQLAHWARVAGEPTMRDALLAALTGSSPTASARGAASLRYPSFFGSGELWADVRRDPGVDQDDRSGSFALTALRQAAARVLAGTLPTPEDGWLLAAGAGALYGRVVHECMRGLSTTVLLRSDVEGESWLTGPGGPPGPDDRPSDRFPLPDLDELKARRVQLAIVEQSLHQQGVAALRAQLGQVRAYLAEGGTVAVVGSFLTRPMGPRPLAPMLALAGLATGHSIWCPATDVVARQLEANGFQVERTIILPEPDVAMVARLQPT